MGSFFDRDQISLFPYVLKAKEELNRGGSSEVEGYLLRLSVDASQGFSVLQTWPSLGDPKLEEICKDPESFLATDYLQRPLYFANLDRQARSKKQSLLAETKGPSNHTILHDYLHVQKGELFKVKMGFGLDKDLEKFESIRNWLPLGAQLRLDFNSVNARPFLEKLKEDDFRVIDFIEDPGEEDFTFFGKLKKDFPVKIALDRKKDDLGQYNGIDAETLDVIVVKPLKENYRLLDSANSQKLCFTSNMDHFLGVIQANYEANQAIAESYALTDCGLLSFLIFDNSSFSNQVTIDGTSLCFSKSFGCGFGLTDYLTGISDWKAL